jgi:OmpR family response regulator RpaB
MKLLSKKILIADGEFNVTKILKTRLTLLGYNIILANNGDEAINMFKKNKPDLVLLEVILLKVNGYNVCRKLRQQSNVPIIFLTSLKKFSDRALGFKIGADDYVTKPFSPKELEARIQSLFRRLQLGIIRTSPSEKFLLKTGTLTINTSQKQVLKDDQNLFLTETEFKLLNLLATNPGIKFSRPEILNILWGYTPERFIDNRIVDVHISRLRIKIEEDLNQPNFILTVRGVGYMFRNIEKIS